MIKRKPFFSIITICYNEEKTIKKTCESVVRQKYRNFEWIVVDGKSTDNTLKIINKYKKCITNLSSEKDEGIYSAMNKGIKKSRGEYLLFLNGGDNLKNQDVLQEVSDFIQKDNKKTEIYYGNLLYSNGEVVDYKKSVLDKKFFVNKTIAHQATFIKRNLFSKYGKYDEHYKIVSDYDFWIKVIIVNKVKTKYLPIIISVFDPKGASTDYKLAKQQIEERNKVLLKYGMINKSEASIWKIKWFLLTLLKKIGVYNIIRKNYRKVVCR
jgi:glycosyltransferase involved in cell wall biosynthesis